jgi:poly(beta-D-mannuronate) lyase
MFRKMQRPVQLAFALLLSLWFSFYAFALNAPFTLHAPVEGQPARACPSPPAPVVELSVVSKYGDNGPLHDTVAPEAEAQAIAQMAPLRAFAQEVVKMANHYTASGDPAAARCALTWLDAWAAGHALTRIEDHNAEFERGATVGGLSLALIQVSPVVAGDARYGVVAKWMHQVIDAGIQYFDSTERLQGSRNNHRYWTALGAAGTAVVTGDRRLLDWSVDTYRKAVCGAIAEGGLPLELERGKKALDYHLFALDALTPIAAIAEANGINAFGFCDGAFHRIVRFSLLALDDPSTIAKLAGRPQDQYPGGLPSKNHASFVEIYHHYFPGKAPLESRILTLRPLLSTNLGGDQTLLYGK